MKKQDDALHLSHILKATRRIVAYTENIGQADFDLDFKTQDAVVRQLEVVGEAVKRISPEFRAAHPQLPWRGMAGMRDMLIHQYDEIDFDIVWKTATESIPAVLVELERISMV
jgi:uncharacterized protein with HEPN domain